MTEKTSAEQIQRIESLVREVKLLCFPHRSRDSLNLVLSDVSIAREIESDANVRDDSLSVAASGDSTNRFDDNRRGSSTYLAIDPSNAEICWITGHEDAAQLWNSLGITAELSAAVDGMFAGLIIHEESRRLVNWMFEAVALGPDEDPDPRRSTRRPRPVGAVIPIETSSQFSLNKPLRIAVYIIEGVANIGCILLSPKR